MTVSLIRGPERAVTATEWLVSRHSFSFGDHYDPYNTHYGVLLAINDDLVSPGHGFDSHAHQETEIVTWVVEGTLVHRDSAGHCGVLYPGLAQRMSAGSGVRHSERNDPWPDLSDSGRSPVRYIQMWVMPDNHGLEPSYEQANVSDLLRPGKLVPVASGEDGVDSAIRIANAGATLYAARLTPGQCVEVPPARFTHVFVTAGEVVIGDDRLGDGDALRADDADGLAITATSDAEVLVWAMNKRLGE
ncbi:MULTISPECIES: pirin-like bicupin family protein [unclassified Gordonia (in: high G+C Gram-positive bacteria)]|uniref:pirin family protein n=1 Tax=unclassified Gordonia (in: high G+C Gram-positive bacteria) TaxID=2657482 RepID=UPI001F115B83|nr:pirin-like bicupin family protein [Gordonia sp. ABSL49_1]MCH5641025.1 pirin family protein [Gordonia sp. ABSL49_1]